MSRLLPLVAGLLVVIVAVVVFFFQQSASDRAAPSDQPFQEERTASASDAVLAAPDTIGGHAYLDTSAGLEADQLIQTAPVVLIGTVKSATLVERPKTVEVPLSAPADPGHGHPPVETLSWTTGTWRSDYVIEVEEYLRFDQTDRPSTVTVREGGGIVDGQELMIDGIPLFRVGQRYLLFLERNPFAGSEGTFYSLSGIYGANLLFDGKVYREIGRRGEWLPYTILGDAPSFVTFLRSAAHAPAQR